RPQRRLAGGSGCRDGASQGRGREDRQTRAEDFLWRLRGLLHGSRPASLGGRMESADASARMRPLDLLRADTVGSLLRPSKWREARAAFDEGRLAEPEFRRVEDEAVRDAIRLQESLGFEVV